MGLAAAVTGGALAAGSAGAVAATGAAITGAAGLAGAAVQGSAAKSAASTQANVENQATQTMEQQYQQTRSDLSPFTQAGQAATSEIQNQAPFNFSPTEAQLEQTPGYQFNLTQGLKATQNGYAAQGLGSSGAALKGAATYASGLADTTYQNQFTNALNSYNTNLDRLQNLAATGENAGAQTGSFGTTTAGNIGQATVGGANATAAGTIGSANATAAGFTGVANAGAGVTNAYLLNSFLGGNGGGIYGAGGGGGGGLNAQYLPNPNNPISYD